MHPGLRVVTLLVTALCLTHAEPDVNAVTSGPAGTTGTKAIPQTKPLPQAAAAPVSAEALLGIIGEAFRGTSAVYAPLAT